MSLWRVVLKSEMVHSEQLRAWEQKTRVVLVDPYGTESEIPQDLISRVTFTHDAKVGYGEVSVTLFADAELEAPAFPDLFTQAPPAVEDNQAPE